jgi:RND superfamily putative drug exporter
MLKLTRWTIAHRRIVVVAWIVLAVGVLGLSQAVGKRNANNFSLPNTDSQRAVDLMQSKFPTQAGDSDQIVFRTRDGKLTDQPARTVIAPMLARVARLPTSQASLARMTPARTPFRRRAQSASPPSSSTRKRIYCRRRRSSA